MPKKVENQIESERMKKMKAVSVPDDAREFAELLKALDEKQQLGLKLLIEGMKLLSEEERKKRH